MVPFLLEFCDFLYIYQKINSKCVGCAWADILYKNYLQNMTNGDMSLNISLVTY